ncbi:hypothetical protein HMPREF1544_02273 [Mucor circinelloides 1006PhL]|uniref:Spore coat protein CotH n=1 Tax=Mucor circinelloides f. circinelloides (strain 1006PhL) TaxID=1220926 RepID=S2JKJ7_MUCC1|nr:hypothetical protein HMPREF1544_02273 [Mucor circinelloides 1006PhL]
MLQKPQLLVLLLGISNAIAQNITYKVVTTAIDHDSQHSMGVLIDNYETPFPLIASEDMPYIYTGNAPIAKTGYSYVRFNKGSKSLEEREAFTRDGIETDSMFEFYNRSRNTYSVPELPKLYEPVDAMHRVASNLHYNDRIPTFFLSGDISAIQGNSSKGIDAAVNVTYVGLDEAKTFKGAKIQLSGRGTRNLPKASYKIKFNKRDMLFGYRKIKFRSLTTDPSYIREKLAFDLAESFGLPTTRYSYARLFINNKPYGLFGIEEDFSNPWVANEFNNGVKKGFNQGILYNGAIRSNLEYLGESEAPYLAVKVKKFGDTAYSIKAKPAQGKADMKKLIALTKFLKNAPSTEPDAVAIWNQHLDTDSVLRSLALEIFLGDTDGYISSGDNYYIYEDPAHQGRFVYIIYDLDLTQGSASRHYVSQTLKGDYTKFLGYNEKRPLLHQILKVPEFKSKFESILRNIIQKQRDNQDFLYQRIDALSVMLKEDVAWDKSISRESRENTVSQYLERIVEKGKENNGKSAEANVVDYSKRILYNNIPFDTAVNGTINRLTIMGLKEWYSKMIESYSSFV